MKPINHEELLKQELEKIKGRDFKALRMGSLILCRKCSRVFSFQIVLLDTGFEQIQIRSKHQIPNPCCEIIMNKIKKKWENLPHNKNK